MPEPYIGEIRMFGGTFAPAGWVPCDGRELPVAPPYLDLYEVIGTSFGGGPDSFALPDLRDPNALSSSGTIHYIIAIAGERPMPIQRGVS